MKSVPVFLLAALCILGIPFSFAQESVPAPAEPPPPEEESAYNDTIFGLAATLSQSFSSTTGIAMSPLLGMGVLGVWKYYRTDREGKNELPWYAHPWAWGVCLGIFALLKSKDILGAWIPEMVKKPITVIDDLQEKASALIVGLAVIPVAVYEEFRDINPRAIFGDDEVVMAMAPALLPVIMIVVSVAIFAVVWLAFNAFSSIKVFSPFATVNTGLSIAKGGIMAVYAAILALNPFVAVAVAIGMIIISVLIFGWAFRWNVFGILFVKDFLTGAFDREVAAGERMKGFTTASFPGIPPRTYGTMKRVGDDLEFTWNPWLIGPPRKQTLSLTEVENSVRKGLFLPSLTVRAPSADRHRSVFDFRLRFRGHHDAIRENLGLDSVSPNLVLTGLRAGWIWVRDQLSRGGSSLAQSLT